MTENRRERAAERLGFGGPDWDPDSTLQRTSPCHDCPWRRNAKPGWLGSHDAAEFVVMTERGEGDMPCHTAIDYRDPNWRTSQLPDSPLCAGGLQYLANQFKEPMHPELAEAVGKVGRNPKVFAWAWEFLSYHLGREVTREESFDLRREAENNMALRARAEIEGD